MRKGIMYPNNSMKVYRFSEDGSVKEYQSMSEAKDDIGIHPSAISNAILGNSLRCGGYYWSRDKKDSVKKIIKRFTEKPLQRMDRS